MKTPLSRPGIRSRFNVRLLAALIASGGAGLSAAEVTGTFEDKCIAVTSSTLATPPAAVSLHALFNLDFDGADSTAYSGTQRVQLTMQPDRLDLTLRGNEDKVIGTQSWKMVSYEAPEGDGVMVRVQAPHAADDSFLILLESHSAGKLLQARVIHARTTLFGQQLREVGTYYAPRSP